MIAPNFYLKKISVLLSSKDPENILAGSGQYGLFPEVKIKWSDFCVGQPAKISAQYEQSISDDFSQDITPISQRTAAEGSKVQSVFKRMSVAFSDVFTVIAFLELFFPNCQGHISLAT